MKHPYRWQKPNVQLFTDTFSCCSTIHLSVVEKRRNDYKIKSQLYSDVFVVMVTVWARSARDRGIGGLGTVSN